MKLIKQGAEGRIYLGDFNGNKCLIKERFEKKYRHPELDVQISRQRMKAETKAAGRCETAGILAPKMFHMDLNSRKIYMEYYENAITVKKFIKDVISSYDTVKSEESLKLLCSRIGAIVGKMHANNIIHGDLTTSNILIDPVNNSFDNYNIIMIDFGLSHYNQGMEDKGVDLYVLERALLSTHSELPELFNTMLVAYRKEYQKDEEAVISKFEEVRARGRKRTMIG